MNIKIKLSKQVLAEVDARAELRLKQEKQARINREKAIQARLKENGIEMLVRFGAYQDQDDQPEPGNYVKFDKRGVPVSFSEYAGLNTNLFRIDFTISALIAGAQTVSVWWDTYYLPDLEPSFCSPIMKALGWDILPIWGHVPDGEYLVKVAGQFRRAVKDGLTVIVHPHKTSK